MRAKSRAFYSRIVSSRGITIPELLVVLAILTILTAIATPWYIDWRRNMVYKTTAKDINYILREARSRSITQNLQHRVEFDAPGVFRQYRLVRGNLAFNSTLWNTIVHDWAPLSNDVRIVPRDGGGNIMANPNDNIIFNTNGSGAFLGNATIEIWPNTGAPPNPRYTVTVESITGRIRVVP